MEKEFRCDIGLKVGSERATGGSERIEDRLVDDRLVCKPMLGGMAGIVARRGSWCS